MARTSTPIQLRLYDEDIALVDEIKQLADKASISQNEMVVLLLKRGLKEYKKGAK